MYTLTKPGELTDWIRLADVLIQLFGKDEKHSAAVSELGDLAVKLRILPRGTYLELADDSRRASESGTPAAVAASDERAVRAGLAGLRGTDLDWPDSTKPPPDGMFEALAASSLNTLISSAVFMVQRIKPEERAGFFTSAPNSV